MVWSVAFFTLRHLVTHDTGMALRPSRLALRGYAWVILFQFVPTAIVIYAEPILKTADLVSTANVGTLRRWADLDSSCSSLRCWCGLSTPHSARPDTDRCDPRA